MRKIIISIALFLSIVLISRMCFAEETNIVWTDFSNAEISIMGLERFPVDYVLEFKNVVWNENSNYDVYFRQDSKIDFLDNLENVEKDGSIVSGRYNIIEKNLEKDGDLYLTVIEKSLGEEKVQIKAKKIERPEQNKLGSRIIGYFSSEESKDTNIISLNEPHDSSNGERKVKVKLGKIDDKNVLEDIKKDGSNALDKLLIYAKKQDPIISQTLKVGTDGSKFLSKTLFEDGEYYYIFFEAEDENGKFYQVEDIMLAQAKVISNKMQLVNYGEQDFVWKANSNSNTNNIANNTNKVIDNTVANKIIPATGKASLIAMIIIISIMTVMALYINCRRFKNVK